jgi:hypothetical protein
MLSPRRWLLLAALLCLTGCGADQTDVPGQDATVDLTSAEDHAVVDLPRADAAIPDAPVPDAPGGPRPVWLLHLTDIHIGAQPFAVDALTTMVQQVEDAVEPTATLNTGDVTDTGTTTEWTTYRGVIQGQILPFPLHLEVIGNHDVKTEDGKGFLVSSQTGKAGAGLHGLSYIDTPQGRIRVVRTNTVDSSVATNQLLGFIGETQVKSLEALPPSPIAPAYTVVAGHHPLVGIQSLQILGTDKRMRELLDHFSASVYLCGHAHFKMLSWAKDTLVVQGPTLGKPELVTPNPGFAVVALDTTGPAARVYGLTKSSPATVSWPLVLITTPADADLGGTNPHAKPLAPGGSLDVRALAFDPGMVQVVEARIDSDAWVAMAAAGRPLWQLTLTAPTAAGKHKLEVRVLGSVNTGTDAVSFTVASP